MADHIQTEEGEILGETSSAAHREDLRSMLDAAPDPVVIVDENVRIQFGNSEATTALGIEKCDAGKSLWDVVPWLSRNEVAIRISEVIAAGCSRAVEGEDPLGRRQLIRMRPYRASGNSSHGAVLSFQDIHDLRTAQAEANNARIFAKSLVGTVQIPLVVLRENFSVKAVNEAFHEHFGTQPVDLEERFFLEIQQNRFDLDGLREALARILGESAAVESFEAEHEINGDKKHVEVTVRLVRPATEKMLLIALNDITVRKEAEKLLMQEHQGLQQKLGAAEEEIARTRKEAQLTLEESRIALFRSREELRHLTASLLHAQDEERRRVSRELHDDLSQRVAKLQFEIEILEQKIPFSDLEDAREKLRGVRDEAVSLADDLRRVAHQLHPSILDHLGLAVALDAYVSEFSRSTGINVDLSKEGIPEALAPETASCAYRITQEALRNVAKHAQTDFAEVVFRTDGSFMTLLVRDRGKGFDLPLARTKGGLGLIGLEERVRLIGGAVNIETGPNRGTSVFVRLPIQLRAP